MNETSKCVDIRRERGDFDNFLKGNVIDICCGPDPLKIPSGTVEEWDIQHGNAQTMKGVEDGLYSAVFSSHGLEHLRDVPEALKNWMRITKPGGHLYIVVPDYVFYEKMLWPSRYNPDHKNSFSQIIERSHVGRSNHWHINNDLIPLLKSLNVETVRVTLELNGFDFNRGPEDQTLGIALSQICIVGRKNDAA